MSQSPSSRPIDLSVILVNYNGGHYLKACIDALLKSQTHYQYEIILIDNASSDASLDSIATLKDRLKIIQNAANLGFTVANNQGLKIATGKFIFFLNTDTLVSSDTLEILLRYGYAHSNMGAVSPRLRHADGTIQIPGNPLLKSPYKQSSPQPVSFISGAAFFTSTALMHQLGGMDEAFFFYNDDIDLCLRIRKMGKPLIQLPNADVLHYGGGSSQSTLNQLNLEGMRGGLVLVKKHYPSTVFHIYRIGLLVFAWIMLVGNRLIGRSSSAQLFAKLLKIIINNDFQSQARI